MSGKTPAVMMGSGLEGQSSDAIRAWLAEGPSDLELARAYAAVHNHVGCNMYEEDVLDEEREDWELLERQMLYQIAKRWLPAQGISWSAGWWVDDGKGRIYETIDFPETENGDLIVPYSTPLGGVCLWVDDEPTVSDAHWEHEDDSDYARRHPVDGNYRIAYHHVPDGASHQVKCLLSNLHECDHGYAGGERLVGIEISDEEATVFIGVEWDDAEGGYDYRAELEDFGVAATIPSDAKEQWIVFGLSWVEKTTEENATNPWLMGNPTRTTERPQTFQDESEG